MNAPQAFESKEDIGHYVGGSVVNPKDGRFSDVYNPAKGAVARRVALASRKEVDSAVAVAQKAFESWSQTSPLRRARILFKYLELLNANRDELAAIITAEHGKVFTDAQGEVTRGIEILEFATGIPELLTGDYTEQVSTDIDNWVMRQPLGVVAGITPFNFPVMVPMWMFPMAIACGNTFILKPSPTDPSASLFMAKLLKDAGLPDGVFNVVQGDKEAVDALEKELSNKEGEGVFQLLRPRPSDQEENWYSWNVENWGTKWETSVYSWEKLNDNSIRMNFDTAWSPPIAFYDFLAQNTEWYVTATYCEEGMGFVGRNIGGDDEYYQYSDAEDLDEIPEELVEEYNLRAQFEDEEELDLTEALEELKAEFESLQSDDSDEKNAFADENGRQWLKDLLHERVVGVTFTKKDGTERVMQATLSENFIPEATNTENSATTRKKSDEALAVWDVEAEGWRSFRWDSIKSVNFSLGE